MRFMAAVALLAALQARTLEDPQRDAWQKPDEVIRALNLRAGEVVADIGAGSGYFTRRLAREAAKVYAVDVEARTLARARASSPRNVNTVLAAAHDPKLSPGSIDTAFLCDVLHRLEARAAYYAKLKSALKPGGRIVIIDFHKKPLPVGPPLEMRFTPEEVTAELAAAGFSPTASHTFLEHQYFLEFSVRP